MGGAAAGPGGQEAFFNPFQELDPRLIEQLIAAGAFGGPEIVPQQPEPRSTGPPPTAAATLRALPKVKVTKHDIETNESDECAICLDDLVLGQPALRIPCGHLYHEDCVKDWLKKSNECPVCRFELPTDDAEYERERKKRTEGRKVRMRYQDLAVKTAQELQRLAKFLDVDVRGCLEKSELVQKIAQSSKVEIILAGGEEPSSAAASPAGAGPTLSRARLDAMSDAEARATLEQLGIDASDCSDKAQMVSRLILSGRVAIVNDAEDTSAPSRPAREAASGGSEDVPMPTASGDPSTLPSKSVGELRKLARELGVSLDGCLEKGEIVSRIAASPGFHG